MKEPNDRDIRSTLAKCIGPVPDPHKAEYEAVLHGLRLAQTKDIKYVAIFSDSRTVVNQLNGLWKARDHLEECRDEVCRLLKEAFKGWQVSWIPRERNGQADQLVEAACNDEEVVHASELETLDAID